MALPDRTILWDHIIRHHGDAVELTADQLEESLRGAKHEVDRWSIIGFYKEMQARRLGVFYVGRRGARTRIAWNDIPREMAYPWREIPVQNPSSTRMLEQRIPVRPDVNVVITAPSDLSRSEAERVI